MPAMVGGFGNSNKFSLLFKSTNFLNDA